MEGNEGLDALFEYATEGILVIDDSGTIVRINASAERMFGYDRSELPGKPIEHLVPTRFAREHTTYRERYEANPHARAMGIGMDLFALKKDGSEFPVEISLSPYTNNSRKFVIAFIIDISARKLAEEHLRNYSFELERQVRNRTMVLEEAIDELEKTKKELHTALEKERELNELKSRFVSMASHEFRTPLTTIMSSLTLVTKYRELNDTENQDRFLGKIRTSINNLTDILDDFLSVSKLEEGKVLNNPERFNLKEFVEETVSEMRPFAPEEQEIIHTHTGMEEACLDKKLLKNVLFNLISNAVKFSPERKPIHVSSETAGGYIRIRVADQGIGVSEADQKHLFERFFRGQNATYIQGTGLGLNIVAKYAELMDGIIDVQSKEHKGTVFTITFPE
jgi:PAS domain S-box-containing protein